jgi:aspartyl protease family protein
MYKTAKITILISLIILTSCGGKKATPAPLGFSSEGGEDFYTNTIDVPFKKEGGVRTIQVRINDCAEVPMIFDTGCSGVSISVLELYTLIKHGNVSESDVVGMTYAQIADGSIVEKAIVNLKKLQIGDYICYDVQATISENENAPLLLGNGALKDVESFVVDDENEIITFNLR